MAKARLTVSMDAELLRVLDRHGTERGWRSRSAAVAHILAEWVDAARRAELDQETEAYYLSLTAAERQEDGEWDEIAAQSARLTWDAGD